MPQQPTDVARRTLLKGGAAAALTGLTVVTVAGPARAFPGHTDGGVVIPWLDQPTPVPLEFGNILAHPLVWEDIEYLTPNDEFFTVKHYNQPQLSPTTGACTSPDWSHTRSACRCPTSSAEDDIRPQ